MHQSRNSERHCDICFKEGSQDGRNASHRRPQQACGHHPRTRSRYQPARSTIVAPLGGSQDKVKPASRIPHIVVGDQSWNVPIRQRKASMTSRPLTVTVKSLWDGVGGPPQPRDLSPSTASTNTDELLERDAEAVELQERIARSQRDRAAFGRRLHELESTMRNVRAEMNDLRGRQRDREDKVTKHTRQRFQ